MKLLLDQNLSPRLVTQLADIYPDSIHVQTVGLDHAPDEVVWNYARQQDYIIVTKDANFHERSILFGFPPKVVWISHGNCSTNQIEAMLRQNHAQIQLFSANNNLGCFALF